MATRIYKDGITMTVPDNELDRYTRIGFTVKGEADEPEPDDTSKTVSDISMAEIYIMCDKAGVLPADLELSEHPTKVEVKSAIKAAQNRKAAGEVNNG